MENSENITLKNLTIDWADPFCSEGLIVARDTVKGTFDMKIADSNPYEIRNNQLIFIKPYRITSYNVCYTKLLRVVSPHPPCPFLHLGRGSRIENDIEAVPKHSFNIIFEVSWI